LLAAAGVTALAWVGLPRGLPATYLVRTTLHVSSRRPFLLHAAQDGPPDFAAYQPTQAALITSRPGIIAALAEPRVSDRGLVPRHASRVAWLEKAIKADYSIAPEILSISLSGENPDELVLLVNAIREAYLKEIVNREQNELTTRLDRLKEFHKTR